MSQPQQPAYGGRPGYGGYNAPPPSNYQGYPPVSSTPHQDPGRYAYGGGPQQHGPPSQVPPVGSSPAFFMVPPNERTQQTPKPGPPSDPYTLPPGRVPVGGRPQSYAPQELATSQYDSPVDNRHSFHAPSQPPQGYETGGYPPQQGAPQGPPQGQQNPYEQLSSPPPQQAPQEQQPPSDPYSQQPPQQGYGYPPQQPGYAPPAPPGATSSPAPPAQGYLPYRPGGQQAPSAPPVGGDDAAGFYR